MITHVQEAAKLGPPGEPGASGLAPRAKAGPRAAGSYLCETVVGGSCLWSPARTHLLALSSGIQQLASRAWEHSSMTATSKYPSGNNFRGPSEEAPGQNRSPKSLQKALAVSEHLQSRQQASWHITESCTEAGIHSHLGIKTHGSCPPVCLSVTLCLQLWATPMPQSPKPIIPLGLRPQSLGRLSYF